MVLQDDTQRLLRFRCAQEDFQLTDEHAGGQQGNSLLALQRDERLSARSGGARQTMAAAAAAAPGPTAAAPTEGERPGSAAAANAAAQAASGQDDAAAAASQNGHAEVGHVPSFGVVESSLRPLMNVPLTPRRSGKGQMSVAR